MNAAAEDVLERRVLTPDPRLIHSLGTHHSLQSAIADLVDNSIDAGASRILISFETEGEQPLGLTVVDDGRGMDEDHADEAMRLGARREYQRDAQGHFGIGLKAASFSHADTLTICTSPGPGEYHGRRLVKADVQSDYGCDVLDPAGVKGEVDNHLALLGAESGTIVRWSNTRFPRVTGLGKGDWLEDNKTQLRMHLGVIYHRLLSARRIAIDIEVYDHTARSAGAPEAVVPIDPLGFSASAVSGYPRKLIASVGARELSLECHIVPPKSSGPSFRLFGRDGAEYQGFYIYRNDRLLQVGGWNDVITSSPHRALARVVVDDFHTLRHLVRMNPEKQGIAFSHELGVAVAQSAARDNSGSAISFADYIGRAEAVLAESRRRRRSRRPVAEPGKGLHEEIRRVIRAEIPIRTDEGPIEIRWRRMPREKFLELEREERVVYLNKQYREMLTGGRTGLSDAPLLKTLIFLLTQEHFTGRYWGSRDRDLIEMWDTVLGAAVQTEYEYRTSDRAR